MPAVNDEKKKLMASKKGLLGSQNAQLAKDTSYKIHYPAPPLTLYTGISPNLGLKAKVEGTAGASDPSKLGLGDEGRSFYQRTYNHFGDAYKNKTKAWPTAKITHIKPKADAAVDYTTSYSVWGKTRDLGDRPTTSAKPAASRVSQDFGLGDEGRSMYKRTYLDPKMDEGYAETVRVTKEAVEGDQNVVIEPYGPLCKSLTQESYPAPPMTAYGQRAQKDKKSKHTIPVGTVKPQDPSIYGIGEFGSSLYKDTYIEHDLKTAGQRPATATALKIRQGSLRPGKILLTATSYKDDFIPPPQNMYTGISPNLGLKQRVEGVGAPSDPAALGLGDEGKSFYQRTFNHFGDAYKNKTKAWPTAKITHIKPKADASVDYTTSYSVWGKSRDLGERPNTAKPPTAPASTNYGLGDEGTSMYKRTFLDPKNDEGYAETVRVTKEAVEGDNNVVMEPYGPLCKSLSQESYPAPPRTAYRQPVESDSKKLKNGKTLPVGTLKPDRDYGLGRYGKSSYSYDYVNKFGLGVVGEVPKP